MPQNHTSVSVSRREPGMKLHQVYAVTASAVLLIPLFLATSVEAVAGPSFNCNKASADDEIAICSSSELSELDNLMAAGFQFLKMRLGKKQANQIARPLLSLRQACGGDVNCIQQRQADAVEAYRKLGAPIHLPAWMSANTAVDASGNQMPARVGECSESAIDDIGARLEGDQNFESGTSVSFANGGGQVSYDKEWSIIRSKIGDPVQVCLVSIPKGCPPGDDRGKVYKTTNLRTGESWELPDSQHMCGGA